MAPVPPTAHRQSSQRSIHDTTEQAGRSATNLHAQLAAATAPGRLRKQNSSYSATSTPPITRETSPSGRAPNPRQDVVPGRPSSHSNHSSYSISSGGQGSNSSGADTRNADAGAGIAAYTDLPPPPRIPAVRGEMSSRTSSSSLSRLGTPRSVRDLGADYTRYYNPFATRNNSATDLTTFLPLHSASTLHLPPQDSSKRHSNPFADEKRFSNGDAKASHVSPAAADPMTKPPNTFVDEMDPEKSFFPYLDDRLGAPDAANQGYTFPMYWDEKEEDDELHLPMIDDDKKLKPTVKEHFTRENVLSTLGMLFMLLGLLCLFIVLPIVSSTGLNIIDYTYGTPIDQMGSGASHPAEAWATVNNRTYSLMSHLRKGLVDPDTPEDAKTRQGVDGSTLKLVFSDEFNAQNRTFFPGDDPFFFGFEGWYGATQDLEWYDPDAITTFDGALQLQMDAYPSHGLQFRSGMLNSWNQLCFKGGRYEVSVSLPGPGGVHGLWPGVWSMGNLGRPGYLATTDGMWPYTYNECDVGITPNQSQTDGLSYLPGQRLTSCGCSGSDHPTPGTGRGAPEIDIIEVSGDWGGMGVGVATQSYQVAPFDVWWYPNYDFFETPDYSMSFVNTYTGGPYQQAVSTTTMLNNSWYDGVEYQRYSYEYYPGNDADSTVTWRVADTISAQFDARAIGPNGNIGQRPVSQEPMSMIMNLGISNNWVDINFAALKFPTIMRIDYVRLYQKEGEESITCDPPGYETTEYIANHPEAYNNPNYTVSTHRKSYQRTLLTNCAALG